MKKNKIEIPSITEFELFYDNVLVEWLDDKQIDGLSAPGDDEFRPMVGLVISVGPGKVLDSGVFQETNAKPGDIVKFNKYATDPEIEYGKKYYWLKDEDCRGGVRKNNLK